MKTKAYRHGEVVLAKIDTLPKGLTPSKETIFMTGSHGNHHAIDQGTLYFKKEDNFVFGYLEAKNTSLLHPEHKDKSGLTKIEDGYYKLIKQQEYTPEGLIPVID